MDDIKKLLKKELQKLQDKNIKDWATIKTELKDDFDVVLATDEYVLNEKLRR